jgi:hypothetical protein
VPFVHQHEVVPLEGVDGDGLLAHLVAQARHLEDLHRLPTEQSAAILVEDLRSDASGFELAQVLLRQPFVGGQQQDAVQLARTAVRGQRLLVLQNVGVHQVRLAAPCRHPECQLVELRPHLGRVIERLDLIGLRLVRIVCRHLRVQRRQ